MASIIKKSNIKKFTDKDVSEGFKTELEKKTIDTIKKAGERCEKNKRRTLLSQDV